MSIANPIETAKFYGLIEDTEVAITEGGPFVIAELGGKKREVRLSGRSLPYQPFTLCGTMTLEETWYPGNPIATFQVLGAKEEESTINGYWKDRFLAEYTDTEHHEVSYITDVGEQGFVADVMDLVKLFDDIRRNGQLLRVTWDEIARDGILVKFEQKWHRRHDVEWAMTFKRLSQAEVPPPTAAPAPAVEDDHFAMLSAVNGLVNQFKDYLLVAQTTLRVVDDFVQSVKANVQQINTAVDSLGEQAHDLGIDVGDAALKVAAVFGFISDTADTMMANEDREPPRSSVVAASPAAVSPGTVIAAERYLRDLRVKARTVRNFAAAKHEYYLQQADPVDLLQVFVARDGQDLRYVSSKFYGQPEDWRSIMLFNKLSTSKLNPGQLVYVPRRPTKAA